MLSDPTNLITRCHEHELMPVCAFSSSSRRSNLRRGFTLLELIVVMVILCIAAAVVSASLRTFWASTRTKNAASDVLTLMHYAHTQAIADATLYRLNFDTSGRFCQLGKQSGTDFVPLGNSLDRGAQMPDDMRIAIQRTDGIVDHIDFFADGRVEPAVVLITDPFNEGLIIESKAPAEMFHLLPKGATP